MVRLLQKPPGPSGAAHSWSVAAYFVWQREEVFANHLQLPKLTDFCVKLKKNSYVFSFKATTVVGNNYTNNGIGASIPLPTTDAVKCDYHIPILYGKW